MKTLQKVLEENDAERKRLVQLVTTQELQLQQKPDPRTMDEHQLQRYLDILCDIMDSKKKLLDAEDEHHITATEVKILQEEAICSQKHATTLVSGCRNDPVITYIHSHLLSLPFHSPSFYIPPFPAPILFLSCLHAHLSLPLLTTPSLRRNESTLSDLCKTDKPLDPVPFSYRLQTTDNCNLSRVSTPDNRH